LPSASVKTVAESQPKTHPQHSCLCKAPRTRVAKPHPSNRLAFAYSACGGVCADTGLAYQPINTFLRQISRLTGEFRLQMARHPTLTFASTVTHLCSAIRKLAQLTEANSLLSSSVASPTTSSLDAMPGSDVLSSDEPQRKLLLYRSVRGNLPDGFLTGGSKLVTEPGFMSVSRSRDASVWYMQEKPSSSRNSGDGGDNVLWHLNAIGQTSEGFHVGADVSPLSMYPEEEEILYPPNVAMTITDPEAARWVEEHGRRFIVLDAVPTFI
jgi:hypothetical protein